MKNKFSEPRVLVLGGNKIPWSASDLPIDKSFTTGIESWAYALNGDYKPILDTKISDLKNYDIIIGNSNFHKFLEKIIYLSENRPENVSWVTLIEGSATDYIIPDSNMVRLLNNSDLVNCINIHSLSFFQNLTSVKVEYIGIPYPVDLISKYRIPFDKRRKEILICPYPLSRINEIMVAKKLGLPYLSYEQIISHKLRNLSKFISNKTFQKDILIKKAKEFYNDNQMIIKNHLPISEYFKTNNALLIWLNLDPRYTWGRFVLDAAALQIPIITTKSTGHGQFLYPETCLEDEFQIDKAIELGKRLINDKDFYKQVAEYPEDKLESYNFKPMAKKLLDALNL